MAGSRVWHTPSREPRGAWSARMEPHLRAGPQAFCMLVRSRQGVWPTGDGSTVAVGGCTTLTRHQKRRHVMRRVHEVDGMGHFGRTSRRSEDRTYWSWVLVGCAWGVVLLAMVTGQTRLIDHDYLLEQIGLPWAAALAVFLLCWQVMIAAMMLPATLPILSRDMPTMRGPAQAVFLTGYALV